MSTTQPPRPLPVLPQYTRPVTRFAADARQRQVLQTSRAPAQMNLFQRPSANDPK